VLLDRNEQEGYM